MKSLFSFNSPRRRIERAAFGFIFATGLSPVVPACGPDFPNRYLDATTEQMLATPEAFFAAEIERIAPQTEKLSPNAPDLVGERSAWLDASELQAVLNARGLPPEKARAIASRYVDCRAMKALHGMAPKYADGGVPSSCRRSS